MPAAIQRRDTNIPACTAADCAVALAVLALALKLTVSGNLLILAGIPYSLEGGSLAGKIHPGSYVAGLAMAARLVACRRSPASIFWAGMLLGDLSMYLLALLFCMLYAAMLTGTGGLATLIDTFLPAAMIGFALAGASRAQLAATRTVLRALFLLNAVLALCEAAQGRDFIPVPAYRNIEIAETAQAASEFRPTALYDHPLTGAAATMLALLLRGGATSHGVLGAVCNVILFAALIVFGGRAALAVFLAALAGAYLSGLAARMLRRAVTWRDWWPAVAAPMVCMAVIGVAMAGGLAGRLQSHLYWDPSAQSRIEQFRILRSMSLEQFILGCRRADLLRLVEPLRLTYNVAAIEDFWLLIFATLGALCFPVFLFAMWSLVRGLWRAGDTRARLMVVTLLLVASASNSLGRKSMLLMLLVACVAASGRGWEPFREHRSGRCRVLFAEGFG